MVGVTELNDLILKSVQDLAEKEGRPSFTEKG